MQEAAPLSASVLSAQSMMEQYGDAQADKKPLPALAPKEHHHYQCNTRSQPVSGQSQGCISTITAAAAHMGPLRSLVNTPAGRIHNNMRVVGADRPAPTTASRIADAPKCRSRNLKG